ncbi:Fic/DOC family protein [Kineococcus xinjiangensis]|uniref:Fic/DOC family protein n=1 Tax=Kineococcus xinjiangensis TaxID=512762 RepID=UPI001B8084D3|nr:Fic family protein [Kineococcus xinjiangensis]
MSEPTPGAPELSAEQRARAAEINRQRAAGDPYLDPETGILRNKVGATTQAELSHKEDILVEARALQLTQSPGKLTFDLEHLQRIHAHLFQDVYDWAGQLRSIDMRKVGDTEMFFPQAHLPLGAFHTFNALHEDRLLRGLPREKFVDRLAEHLNNVNILHPFREGNGRTQRILFDQLAQRAGYELDWPAVRGFTNDHASRAARGGDLQPLREMLASITHPAQTNPNAQLEQVRDVLRAQRAAPRQGVAAEQMAQGESYYGSVHERQQRQGHLEPRQGPSR